MRIVNETTHDGFRVLLVEDHALARKLVEAMLMSFGMVSDVACTGEEALDAAERNLYDVVLLDLGLPDMTAETIIDALAKASGTKDAALIAVTGRDRPYVLPPPLKMWLEKPFALRDLHDALAAVRDESLQK